MKKLKIKTYSIYTPKYELTNVNALNQNKQTLINKNLVTENTVSLY
ncbi:hypothetical protein B4144_0408 [Bacillus atrophaeus]|nr:hypothetical protein B4144_0408 [Bacillus atrophaeus]